MERALNCNIEIFKEYYSMNQSWEKDSLEYFTSYNIISPSVKKQSLSLEDFIKMNNGMAPGGDISSDDLFINECRKSLGKKIIHCNDFSYDENRNFNDVYIVDKEYGGIPRDRVASLHDLSSLKRNWKDTVESGEKYSWKDFLGRYDFPKSNTALIIDRYMFQSFKRRDGKYIFSDEGRNNVHDILQCIIPQNYSGVYSLLLVFDENQIIQCGKPGKEEPTGISIDNAVHSIVETLSQVAKKKSCKLHIEFMALKDSEKFKDSWVDPIQHKLFGLTHDRKLISNYYQIQTSHGFILNKTDRNGHNSEEVKFEQSLVFDSIFSGIDNDDQNKKYLPSSTISNFLADFRKTLSSVNPKTIKCFRYKSESESIDSISWLQLENKFLK